MSNRTRLNLITVPLLLHLLLASTLSTPQGLEAKLSQRAEFIPTANAPKEQLIEIAQHYQLPMGIEWVSIPNEAPRPTSPLPTESTVLEMIELVIRRQPGYALEVRNGVLNIRSKAFSEHRSNFLNLRLSEYKADTVNVFGAEWGLRRAIHGTLHPQRYAAGSNGGYGYGADRDDGFDIKNISFSGRNLIVRDILNAIVKANGNSLWVVELVPTKTMTTEPFFAQRIYGRDVQTEFTWQIIPLSHNLTK